MLYSIITTLVIVGLYQLFAVGRFNYPEFRLKAGQVSDSEIIAPFDFPVLKTAPELINEQDKAVAAVPKPYQISDEPMFEALSTLDELFGVFMASDAHADLPQLQAELKKAGFELDAPALIPLQNATLRDKYYEQLRARIGSLYKRGIYEAMNRDSILISSSQGLVSQNLDKFVPVSEAQQQFKDAIPALKQITEELAPILIKPNLVLAEEKYQELSQSSVASVSQTDGVVLQNEVIVRKNARVTPEDVKELESLQEAYRNRNLRKSPLQEMLLALGLSLFLLIVVSLANHYYGVQIKDEKLTVVDFLPLNAGFIMLVIFAIASNKLLFYDNLLIPFAMTAIAAAILVNFEFGMLYSICNLLVISPFLNWESFTPVILLLSTVMCLLLIKRQNAYHEYLMIWIYLTVSTILAVLSISIYKNDQFLTIIQSVGMGLIAASISVGGILLIVPYYERKWNRATKQTLLELLDFNHPLMKKLATNAVGTYHHSLIVGNLSERAAEAIGANPLLARVGSYYHDIGKVINTEIFTENNEDSSQIHDGMAPDESARLIRNHVSEGIALARKYRIPQPVIDIIMQHHGNSTIRYFYDKAQKENQHPDQHKYMYPGPLPQSKEAVLVMLADIVESTTNAKQVKSVEEISKIIDDTIARILKEGQLSEAPITFKDLQAAKQSMLPVLESIHRKRLDYPETKPDDQP